MLQDPDVREFLEKEEVSIVQTEFHNSYLPLWNETSSFNIFTHAYSLVWLYHSL